MLYSNTDNQNNIETRKTHNLTQVYTMSTLSSVSHYEQKHIEIV